LIEVRTRIPDNTARIIEKLVEKGYFSSMADFVRQSVIDKLLEDFEIGIEELEPEVIRKGEEKKED
jgi:Arc/MetJ-type ribon-helix-helix transcriptional regulator